MGFGATTPTGGTEAAAEGGGALERSGGGARGAVAEGGKARAAGEERGSAREMGATTTRAAWAAWAAWASALVAWAGSGWGDGRLDVATTAAPPDEPRRFFAGISLRCESFAFF